MKKIDIPNIQTLDAAARQFAEDMGEATVVAFHGEMGAGKTTFIRSLAKALGVDDEDFAVNSPSFSIINEYRSATTGALIYHFDLYRLENIEDAMDIGIEDYLDSGAICLIEWPDVVEPLLPYDTLDVNLTVGEDGKRTLSFQEQEE